MSYIGDAANGATFNDTRTHRYTLWRRFEPAAPVERMAAFICLNPSTADETANDPTVTRCINYSRKWGYDGFIMLNAFAYRATDPNDMKAQGVHAAGDPENSQAIIDTAKRAGLVVCAWGNHGAFRKRSRDLTYLLMKNGIEVYYLSLNKTGEPKHPLYLRGDLEPVKWWEVER